MSNKVPAALPAMNSAAPVSSPAAPLVGSAVAVIWVAINVVAGVVSWAVSVPAFARVTRSGRFAATKLPLPVLLISTPRAVLPVLFTNEKLVVPSATVTTLVKGKSVLTGVAITGAGVPKITKEAPEAVPFGSSK
jgi:hypothetical protein